MGLFHELLGGIECGIFEFELFFYRLDSASHLCFVLKVDILNLDAPYRKAWWLIRIGDELPCNLVTPSSVPLARVLTVNEERLVL